MEILTGASKVRVGRGNFSNVGRDQFNDYTIHQTIVQTRDKRAKISRGLPELSEFTEIKRGDIVKDKDICYPRRLRTNGKDDTEVAVYMAQIMIDGRLGESKYTVKTYHGQNATKEWRRDFLRCSKDWLRDVPLFGYNKSSVPLLIFCGELVPIAHIEGELGWVGLYYVELLSYSLGCARDELWVDSIKGRFCRVPIGPKRRDWVVEDTNVMVPSDVEFLQEDVFIRYLASKKEDRWFLAALSQSCQLELLDDIPTTSHHIHVISGLTNSTIAFFENVKWESWHCCLSSGQEMPERVKRFRLRDDRRKIEVESISERNSWLTQALSVFHALNISLDEDLSNYKLVYSCLELTGTLQNSRRKRQRRQLSPPIYLIVLPSPHPLHHWSLDPTGQIPLSPEMCKYLGLPFKLSLEVYPFQASCPTKIYKLIHDYQTARNFDPKTTDFARSFEYPRFTVAPAENRFQELVEEHSELPPELDALLPPKVNNSEEHSEPVPEANKSYENHGEEQIPEELDDSFLLELLFDETEASTKNIERTNSAPTQNGLMYSLLGTLFAPFTWEAIDGSGISAAVI